MKAETTDEMVRRIRAGTAGAFGIDGAKTMRQLSARMEKALRGLLYVIENDELVPESVSYMQEARAALRLPAETKRGKKLPTVREMRGILSDGDGNG